MTAIGTLYGTGYIYSDTRVCASITIESDNTREIAQVNL